MSGFGEIILALSTFFFYLLLHACRQLAECMMGGENQLSSAEDKVNVATRASYPWCKEQIYLTDLLNALYWCVTRVWTLTIASMREHLIDHHSDGFDPQLMCSSYGIDWSFVIHLQSLKMGKRRIMGGIQMASTSTTTRCTMFQVNVWFLQIINQPWLPLKWLSDCAKRNNEQNMSDNTAEAAPSRPLGSAH